MEKGYTGAYEGIPYVELNNGNYLFVVDDEKWSYESVKNWSDSISENLPDIKFVIVLKSVFTDMRNITDEQYEYIKDIMR